MAFITHDVSSDGKRVMSLEEFKRWLKRFDTDKDGRISKHELREAVRLAGGMFATWKANRGINSADDNHNGFLDDNEFKNLVNFAEKHLNIRVTQF